MMRYISKYVELHTSYAELCALNFTVYVLCNRQLLFVFIFKRWPALRRLWKNVRTIVDGPIEVWEIFVIRSVGTLNWERCSFRHDYIVKYSLAILHH